MNQFVIKGYGQEKCLTSWSRAAVSTQDAVDLPKNGSSRVPLLLIAKIAQDSVSVCLGVGFGTLRTSLPLVLSVDCVCRRTSRGVDRAILVRNHTDVMT